MFRGRTIYFFPAGYQLIEFKISELTKCETASSIITLEQKSLIINNQDHKRFKKNTDGGSKHGDKILKNQFVNILYEYMGPAPRLQLQVKRMYMQR